MVVLEEGLVELLAIPIVSIALFMLLFSTFRYVKRKKRHLARLQRFAREGEVVMQKSLAEHYRKGVIVKKNCRTAIFWYTQAAYAGDEEAAGYLQRYKEKRENYRNC